MLLTLGFIQAADMIDHLGKHCPAHPRVCFWFAAIDGDDDSIHSQPDQLAGNFGVEQQAIRPDRDRQIVFAHGFHHLQQARLGQRFTETGEDHAFEIG